MNELVSTYTPLNTNALSSPPAEMPQNAFEQLETICDKAFKDMQAAEDKLYSLKENDGPFLFTVTVVLPLFILSVNLKILHLRDTIIQHISRQQSFFLVY